MSIIFNGNTYTFGATVSANPGTGTTSYVFGGLGSGWTYGFIIWAFNNVGPSSIVGPVTAITLNEVPQESRNVINAFLWSYQHAPEFSNITYTNGGNTYNLFTASEDFGNTYAWSWPTTAGYSRTTGFTAPDGSTTAWSIYTPNNVNAKILSQTKFLEIGNTYILSYYLDLSNSINPSAIRRTSGWNQIDSTTGDPLGLTTDTPITIPPGTTGWWRLNFVYYHNSFDSQVLVPLVRYGGGGPYSAIIWHPQLEKYTG